jgi:ABC-type branched-subunit amino acid transport system ATPase component
MLQVKNLKKYFGGIRAVDGCSFKIKDGEITAIIGPNGSGKTTIFNLISGIVRKDFGEIYLNNRPISSMEIETIANQGVSRIFQQSRLFNNLSVKENLLLAFDNEDTKFWKNFLSLNNPSIQKENRIKEMLGLVNMENFENTPTKNLSYGQKKLIELIRAIIKPHKILILDEPVAGINPHLRNKIADILLKLKEQGETILVIEHDMHFVMKHIADEIIVLDEGKIIAQGKPNQIKSNKKVLEAYLGE